MCGMSPRVGEASAANGTGPTSKPTPRVWRKHLTVRPRGSRRTSGVPVKSLYARLIRVNPLRRAAHLARRIGPLVSTVRIGSAALPAPAPLSGGHLMQSVGLAPGTIPSAKLWPTPQ